jgi:hypothetical protein
MQQRMHFALTMIVTLFMIWYSRRTKIEAF